MKKTLLLFLTLLAVASAQPDNRTYNKPETLDPTAQWVLLDSYLLGTKKFDAGKWLLKGGNLAGLADPAVALTNLGATPIGKLLFAAPTPTGEAKYPQFKLDGTVAWLNATDFKTAIGAGSGGGGGASNFSQLGGVPSDNAALGTALNGKVDTTRLINGKALTSDVSLGKGDVGLGNVDNTSDAAKPVSTAAQTALDGKVPVTRTVNGKALSGDIAINKADVGLGSVSNVDTTNASNLSSGTIAADRLAGGSGALQVPRRNSGNTGWEWITLSGGGDMLKSDNLSGLQNYGTARTNLNLGNVDNTSDANKPVSTAQAAINAVKMNAANGVATGTTTYDKLSPNTVNLSTIANGGTAAINGTHGVFRASFSGATATITLPSSPADGTYTLHGTNASGSRLVLTTPSLIRTENNISTTVNSVAIPSASSGLFTIQFTALAGAFVKMNVSGDELAANADQAQSSSVAASDTGSANTYVITLAPALTAYTTGTLITFKAANANSGASTINVNGLGQKTIKKAAGGVTTDLAANDIRANQMVTLSYDGTNFQMQSAAGNAAAGGGGGGTDAIGSIKLWAISDIATPLADNWLACNGANGTLTLADVSSVARYIVKGGGAVSTPTFSPAAGSYGSTQNVTISSSTPGTTIKYTTDGSTTPSRSVGTTYSSPVAVASTTTLKAIAYRDLYVDSGIATGTFTISAGVTYILNDDLTYVDSSAATTAGWTDNASSPWGSTTFPAPISPFTRSMRATANQSSYKDYVVGSVSSVYFQYIPVTYSSASQIALIENADSSSGLFEVRVTSSTNMRFVCGNATADVAMTEGTLYHIRIDYNSSTKTATFYRSTNGVAGTALATLTNTGSTPSPALPAYVTLGSISGDVVGVFAKLRIRDGAGVPDNP